MNDVISCYTDGSCDQDKLSSWAFIAVKDDKIIHQDSGILTGEVCKLRNISGELKAVIMAISWAKKNNYKVEIRHDLEGAAKWRTGEWKRNNKWTVAYKEFCDKNSDTISSFRWTKAHAGTKFNELADQLAGKTLKDYIKSNNL